MVVYKEINDFCNEHYLVKEENGTVAVYALDKFEMKKTLFAILKFKRNT